MVTMTATFTETLKSAGFRPVPQDSGDDATRIIRWRRVRPATARGHFPVEIRVSAGSTVGMTTYARDGSVIETVLWVDITAHNITRVVEYISAATNAVMTERGETWE